MSLVPKAARLLHRKQSAEAQLEDLRQRVNEVVQRHGYRDLEHAREMLGDGYINDYINDNVAKEIGYDEEAGARACQELDSAKAELQNFTEPLESVLIDNRDEVHRNQDLLDLLPNSEQGFSVDAVALAATLNQNSAVGELAHAAHEHMDPKDPRYERAFEIEADRLHPSAIYAAKKAGWDASTNDEMRSGGLVIDDDAAPATGVLAVDASVPTTRVGWKPENSADDLAQLQREIDNPRPKNVWTQDDIDAANRFNNRRR